MEKQRDANLFLKELGQPIITGKWNLFTQFMNTSGDTNCYSVRRHNELKFKLIGNTAIKKNGYFTLDGTTSTLEFYKNITQFVLIPINKAYTKNGLLYNPHEMHFMLEASTPLKSICIYYGRISTDFETINKQKRRISFIKNHFVNDE